MRAYRPHIGNYHLGVLYFDSFTTALGRGGFNDFNEEEQEDVQQFDIIISKINGERKVTDTHRGDVLVHFDYSQLILQQSNRIES